MAAREDPQISSKTVTSAEPLLASTLWTQHDAVGMPSLTTGCHTIDTVFDNGLSYGTVICLSGEAESGTRDISQALLMMHLVKSANATATVIDATMSFDVRKLHHALSTELRDNGDNSARKAAAEILERVNIMKIFDFVGLTESLAEVRDNIEGKEPSEETAGSASEPPRGTVGDSEDEGEDEMLDTPKPATSPRTDPAANIVAPAPSLLIIDNLTQVVAPLLKNNYVQGQALLSSFMRSLSHLTKAHNLGTILLNSVTSNYHVKDEAPSIFSSCTLHPALGKTFAYMVDIHLLVHQMPKTDGGQSENRTRKAEIVSIVEVLQDRIGSRVGRWAAFIVDETGKLTGVA